MYMCLLQNKAPIFNDINSTHVLFLRARSALNGLRPLKVCYLALMLEVLTSRLDESVEYLGIAIKTYLTVEKQSSKTLGVRRLYCSAQSLFVWA